MEVYLLWGWAVLGMVACLPEVEVDRIEPNAPEAGDPIHTDRFWEPEEQSNAQDLLFVVDNSCSMSEEQVRLAGIGAALFDMLAEELVDFHVGVTTTDVDDPIEAGKLRRINVDGEVYRYIDGDTPHPAAVFSGMVVAGIYGAFDERGRAAAYQLLEINRDQPRNAGFYREDAALHIIFVSDEDDQSVEPARMAFRDWMRQLKEDEEMVKAHAITGIPGQECAAVFDPGTEYIRYANWTGGVVFDLCSSYWGGFVAELASVLQDPRREYFLSELPVLEPWSLEMAIHVEGEASRAVTTCLFGDEVPACEAVYFVGSNSVVLLDEPPPPGAWVEFRYPVRGSQVGSGG